MKLHASGEDYLETILVLQKKRGMVRSVDVARHMEVSKPSVCHAVATLRDGGFLMMDEDHFLHLTDVGREVAEQIYEKHRFFTDRLIEAGVDPVTAEKDACRMEHVISQESFERLRDVRLFEMLPPVCKAQYIFQFPPHFSRQRSLQLFLKPSDLPCLEKWQHPR